MTKILSIAGLLILITISCIAQKNQAGSSVLIDATLNEKQNQFLNNQAEALLSQASEVFSNYPPNWPEPAARRSALMLLDGVLHDVYAPQRPPVQLFYKTRMMKAIEEIEQTEITKGARIWKLYDHGFVIRTNSATIGFDLIRGQSAHAEGFPIGEDYMARLIKQCDVLFISHKHGDHAEEWVAQSFIDQGKPVVAPPEVWVDKSINTFITHLERIPHTVQTLPVQGGKQILKVVVYPGHQGENIENNVSLVITPEGLSFSQMGDQSNSADFEWIDEVGNNHVVDVLMPNCWTTDIVRVAKGFDPALIITGHENEMGHTIDHREPYWLTYQRQEGSDRFGGSSELGYDTPLILMTWGESFHYKRENF
jgi:L-ascorbate metabolism protein UlaG (beta-lactamase superfamily)